MVRRFSTTSRRFGEEVLEFLAVRGISTGEARGAVTGILADIRAHGDAALTQKTRSFDRWEATPDTLRVRTEEIARAVALTEPELMRSLRLAAQRIRTYSERQVPADERYSDELGVMLGWKWTPIDSVGVYVPGGKAAYPSSVLMNAIPAIVAGVSRIAMVVPTPGGDLAPSVLAAAHVAGIEEIYRIGGAQAIGALAYGTQTIRPVDKIVGPGNAFVAEAKRQVFGVVGIDMIAGPSEIVVVADSANDPNVIAVDLLSQAEHDELAQSILITDNAGFASKVEKALSQQLAILPRAAIASSSWDNFGAIILVRDWMEAAEVVNLIAPEHVELAIEKPSQIEPYIRHAGAIFLGRHTPEAIGDYVAGPSHVLPTSRSARFSSGLSVLDFMKRTSLIGCTAESASVLGMHGDVLAQAEGLHAHARSMTLRKGEPVG